MMIVQTQHSQVLLFCVLMKQIEEMNTGARDGFSQELVRANMDLEEKCTELEEHLQAANGDITTLRQQLATQQAKLKTVEEENKIVRAEKTGMTAMMSQKDKVQRDAECKMEIGRASCRERVL